MALLSDWGFFVKPGMEETFKSWLAQNEARMVDVSPKGYEYLGTYVPVWRPAEEGSEYHQLWRYGSKRPPDMRVAAGDTSGAFTELARQFLSFVDETRADDEVFRLYRSAVDSSGARED